MCKAKNIWTVVQDEVEVVDMLDKLVHNVKQLEKKDFKKVLYNGKMLYVVERKKMLYMRGKNVVHNGKKCCT